MPPACGFACLRRSATILQLVRLPNLFTAVADVAMGFLVAQPWSARRGLGPWQWASLGTLAAASVLLYAAGVVLERRVRPGDRPAGAARAAAALGPHRRRGRPGGWAGRCSGSASARRRARSLWWAISAPARRPRMLATAIIVYDAWLKRTPLGPLAMGACRMLNVMLGMSAADAPLRPEVAGGRGHRGLRRRRHLVRAKEARQSARLHLARPPR